MVEAAQVGRCDVQSGPSQARQLLVVLAHLGWHGTGRDSHKDQIG